MSSLWQRVKGRLIRSDNTEQLKAHFEQSASELVAACEGCCDETDIFLDFLNKFLSELVSMRYQVEGVQSLSVAQTQWSLTDALSEQIPTILASLISVIGQVTAREQILISNIEAIANVNRGLEKVEGLVDSSLIVQIKERVAPLSEKASHQLVAIRSVSVTLEKEKQLYESLNMLVKQPDSSALLN